MTCPECGLDVAGREVVTVGALFAAKHHETEPETEPQPYEHTSPCGLTCAYGASWSNHWKRLLGKLKMHPTRASKLPCAAGDCAKNKRLH